MLREGLIYLSQSGTAKTVVTKTPLRGMARRFVPGETVEDLVRGIREANAEGLMTTGNFLGEAVHDEENASLAADVYTDVLDRIVLDRLNANVSLKFTQLGQEISDAFLADNLGRILDRAKNDGLFIRFDMESSGFTKQTLDAFEKLWSDGWRDIGVVLQAYMKRSAGDVARMNQLGARIRLCKGAYAEPPEVALQGSSDVDKNFVALMQMLLAAGNYPAIATHDDRMIDATVDFHQSQGIDKSSFEFQMLHGVRRDLQKQLVTDGYNVRVYVPFGSHWYPYLMRRLAERPANMLFLAGSVVRESPLGFLWRGRT
ncbi:MAG: proline dehydrogenase family protein [Gemmatimonadetes bacterium]|jgi:proline dehydrogenase|nr:proline dehydrogenase family protein [Gemmatimonadota bacterium]